MNENEAHPRAAAMLADAGWSPHPSWGVFTRGTLVMGGDLLGGFHVKDWGMDIHGPDTPDTAEEAAAWLVQRFAIPADVVTFANAPEPEPVHDDPSASDSGGAGAGGGDASLSGEPDDPELASDDGGAGSAPMGDAEPIDADFTVTDLDTIELIEPEEPDFGRELLDFEDELAGEPAPAADASGAFIFGDNLHQMRTAAMGLVVQSALTRLPTVDYAQLSEYRNFAMGVAEGRWPDDPARQERLFLLEDVERLRRRIEAERDAKIEFLLTATREQIEAFDPEDGWL